MTNLTPKSHNKPTENINPFQCLASAVISGALGTGAYLLMKSIAETFASKPITSDNVFVVNISTAVRALVVGVVAFAACMCAMVTLGLIALAIQVTIQRFTNKEMPPEES